VDQFCSAIEEEKSRRTALFSLIAPIPIIWQGLDAGGMLDG
jgi:hypothetical protein